jgi:predicted RNase H-like nuclease (RuvC/YqgF family)
MTAEIAAALKALAEATPFAAGVAVVVFGMIAAIILFGRTKHAFQDVAEEERKGTFQAQLLVALKAMAARETEMQGEIAALRAQNAKLSYAMDEQRAEVALLREQVRRLIDTLVDVRAGRIAPADIALPEGAS